MLKRVLIMFALVITQPGAALKKEEERPTIPFL